MNETRYTALLGCGCIIFPAADSPVERMLDNFFAGAKWRNTGRCLLHGPHTVLAAVVNGSGAEFTILEPDGARA
jgi:hypothetical protein